MNAEHQNNIVCSVSEITSKIKSVLGEYFADVYVEGEISNLTKHASGHCYFSLKDDNASIRCVLFRGRKGAENLELNAKVQVIGSISVYENRGEYQINCSKIIKSNNLGELAKRYEELKEKLKQRGYFDSAHKKILPRFPQKIALLTSRSGAVLQDMKFVANKRWRLCEFSLIDTLVQGEQAKDSIAKNIAIADKLGFDIIVLARGGGSLENLWAFNEEIVAEAIYRAKTPIVSAIGHEVDYMLSDLVADFRAPTPSACMELILPDKNEYLLRLDEYASKLANMQENRLKRESAALDMLQKALAVYRFDYTQLKNSIDELQTSLNSALCRSLKTKQESLNALRERMISICAAHLQKYRTLDMLYPQITTTMNAFLAKKRACLISPHALCKSAQNMLSQKNKHLAHLQEILEAKKPSVKKGFAQIIFNDKITSLQDVQAGDTITLVDDTASKRAKIM